MMSVRRTRARQTSSETFGPRCADPQLQLGGKQTMIEVSLKLKEEPIHQKIFEMLNTRYVVTFFYRNWIAKMILGDRV